MLSISGEIRYTSSQSTQKQPNQPKQKGQKMCYEGASRESNPLDHIYLRASKKLRAGGLQCAMEGLSQTSRLPTIYNSGI